MDALIINGAAHLALLKCAYLGILACMHAYVYSFFFSIKSSVRLAVLYFSLTPGEGGV